MQPPHERSDAERFRRADVVFDAVLDLPDDERVAYLDGVCARDAVLRADVERLLRAHSQSEGFLATPVADRAALTLVGAAVPNASPPPDRIGPYRIDRELGRGGMGVVYLAERDDPDFRQRVALKVVRAGTVDGHSYNARFLTERRVLASLEHPHIARLFDGGVTTDGLPYYTMAYCEGGSLAQRLAAEGRLAVDETLRIVRQLASALDAAHARGVVHRDVKPANILFDAEGSVRLSDFGVAKLLEDDSGRSDAVLGTVAYLAPEQVRGEAVDHRTDLWALGVTMYEMVAGCRPFDGPSYAAVMHAIVSSEPGPLRQYVPTIPEVAESLVRQLLQKDAAARPESAATVLRRLDNPAPANRRPLANAKPKRWRRVAGVAGGFVLVVAGGVYLTLRSSAATTAVNEPVPRDVRRPAADAQARLEYATGRAALNNRTGGEVDLRRAVTHFRAAIARDSEYAIAYSGLSDAYTSLANFGFGPPGPSIDSARSTAIRALVLDSTLAEARTSLGHALCTHDYQWTDADRQFRLAIEHEPGYIYARTTYALCLQDQARFSEALAQLDTARALEPNRQAVGTITGRVLVNAGRPDEAIKTLQRTIDINPRSDMAWQQLGHAYLAKGQRTEAIRALRTAAELTGARDSAHLAYAYAVTGNRPEATRIVQSLVASRSDRYVPPFHVAMAYSGLGQVDEAFHWLDLALAERASFLDGVKVTSAFTPLHGDPRWAALLATMRLDR